MKAVVKVKLKKSILDPQGKAVNNALHHLGFEAVSDVRIGKFIELDLNTEDKTEVAKLVQEAAGSLLSNPVIEDFEYEIVEG